MTVLPNCGNCQHPAADHIGECLVTTDDRGLVYCPCKGYVGLATQAALEATGQVLKEQGAARAEAAQDADDNGEWRAAVDAELERLAHTGVRFTAEDVLEVTGRPARANATGARFMAAARRGLIAQVGTTTATRGPAHGRLLRVWAGFGA